jgi:hypothetical protein
MEKKDFKRLFPHIAEEMETGSSRVDLGKATETEPSTEPSYAEDRKYTGFTPGAIDFIRRCRKPRGRGDHCFLEKKGTLPSRRRTPCANNSRKTGSGASALIKAPDFTKNRDN